MKLLVTGGTGFFGKSLLRFWGSNNEIINSFECITFLSRSPENFKNQFPDLIRKLNIKLHCGDIMKIESLPRGISFTHVLHAATDSTFGPILSPLDRYDQIVTGTRNILDFSVRNGVRKLLLTSSGGVYGPQPSKMEKINEEYCGSPDPLIAENAYSLGKRSAEHLCALYSDSFGLDTVIARCFSFVGPDLPLNAHFAVGNFISDVINKRDIVVKGDGLAIRSYLYQDELAKWLSKMLFEHTSEKVFNIGSSEEISVGNLANLISLLSGGHSKVNIIGSKSCRQSALRNRYVPDISKALEFGLKVNLNLQQSIVKTLSFFN